MSKHAEANQTADGTVAITHQPTTDLLRHQLDRERQRSAIDKRATVAMLAANLAHRVGTPLNVIRGRAEHLLRCEHNPDKTIHGLETIINQVDKIAETVKILLELARQEATWKAFDVRALVRASADLVHCAVDERQVAPSLELGDVPLNVRCDPDQLEQVFINLLRSVGALMGGQSSSLRIITCTSRDGEPRIRVAFEVDTYSAAPSFEPRLFDPFSGCEQERRVVALDLAVAQSIVRDHDGEITVELRERGARIVVNLPPAATSAPHEGTP